MHNENFDKSKKNAIKKYFLFSVISFVLLFLLIAFFSLIMVIFDINKNVIPLFTALSLAISTLFGAYFLGKLFAKKAVIVGTVYGLIIYLLVSIISSIFSNGVFSLTSLFNLLIIFLSSIIGAVIGVNSANRRKIK